ncbi:MAG TPA: cytidylate kinase-like family protein [Roseiflexaceae bacterium]|nr:cytidylate kinase-like family protein [Roseiflexaceae bacterium]
MAVITISRALGSGGLDIAQQVAQTLGYAFADKRTTDGIFRQYGLTKFDDLYNSVPSLLDLLNADNLLLVSMSNEILEALAKPGKIVILGRAGFAVLADYADVLHVRIDAPFVERVQRVMAREGLSDRQVAEERVSADDRVHQQYVQRFYNRQWDAPSNFTLVLDTATLSSDMVVQQIVEAARALEQQLLGQDAATTATIQVDPVLADAVVKVMADPLPALPETRATP